MYPPSVHEILRDTLSGLQAHQIGSGKTQMMPVIEKPTLFEFVNQKEFEKKFLSNITPPKFRHRR